MKVHKMKKLILLALVVFGSWWYFIGGRSLSEAAVRTFYQEQEHATLTRDPEALCALLDADFSTAGITAVGGRGRHDSANKTQTCENYRSMYKTFDTVGEKMGGMLQLDYSYDIHSIEIATDKKSATVDVSYSLDVAGSIMNIRSRATETLVRRNGKTLMVRSEGRARVRNGY